MTDTDRWKCDECKRLIENLWFDDVIDPKPLDEHLKMFPTHTPYMKSLHVKMVRLRIGDYR